MSSETERVADFDERTYGPDDGILVAEDLRKEFGGLVAVDDLSFAVQEQEILGFIGPNGAGKSTTFNCVTGTYPPTGGTVYFRGEDVTGIPAHDMVKKGMSRTFQEFAPLADRPVAENIELALAPDELFTLSGMGGETERLAREICRRVGLGDAMDQTPSELPHAGMLKQELGRAIATQPDVMLVDEPFAGLSGQEVQELTEVMLSLRDHGMTLIVVDHNMRGLLNLIDRAFVIQFGSKIAQGEPDEIKNDPKVQEAYLGGEEI
jgi:branched-chain amino acid transport system ATP-binding protein